MGARRNQATGPASGARCAGRGKPVRVPDERHRDNLAKASGAARQDSRTRSTQEAGPPAPLEELAVCVYRGGGGVWFPLQLLGDLAGRANLYPFGAHAGRAVVRAVFVTSLHVRASFHAFDPSVQPLGKLLCELTAAARGNDPFAQASILDHAERGHSLNLEPFREIGSFLDGDAYDLEGLVVASPLQHLRHKPLHPAATARQWRIEKNELGPGYPHGL